MLRFVPVLIANTLKTGMIKRNNTVYWKTGIYGNVQLSTLFRDLIKLGIIRYTYKKLALIIKRYEQQSFVTELDL